MFNPKEIALTTLSKYFSFQDAIEHIFLTSPFDRTSRYKMIFYLKSKRSAHFKQNYLTCTSSNRILTLLITIQKSSTEERLNWIETNMISGFFHLLLSFFHVTTRMLKDFYSCQFLSNVTVSLD